MDVLLQLQGIEPYVPHNERLQDPLDPITKKISAITGKRKKTEADHWDIAKLEFEGGLYTNGNGPCIPAMNVVRCLQDGATRTKRGKDVPRGIRPDGSHADLIYDGPRTVEEMWKDYQNFSIRKGVVVSGRRVNRTRPMFTNWAAFLPIVVDETIWNLEDLAACWENAGKYAGLGDMRPFYGQFEGTVKSDYKLLEPYPAPEQGFKAAIAYIRADGKARQKRHNVQAN